MRLQFYLLGFMFSGVVACTSSSASQETGNTPVIKEKMEDTTTYIDLNSGERVRFVWLYYAGRQTLV